MLLTRKFGSALAFALLGLSACGDDSTGTGPDLGNRSAYDLALASVGSPAAVKALKGISVEATGTSGAYDETPDPGGPAVTSSEYRSTTSHDVEGKWRVSYQRTYKLLRPGWMASYDEIITGDVGSIQGDERATGGGGPMLTAKMSSARLGSIKRHQSLLNPHLLLRRLAEADVTEGGVATVDGKTQRRLLVKDPDQVGDIELLIDPTSRLTTLRIRESDPLRGDVDVRVAYSGWEAAGELFYPRHVEVSVDGNQVRTEDRTSFVANPTLDAALFTVPADAAPFDAGQAARGRQNASSYYRYAAMGVGPTQDFPKPMVRGVEIGAGSGVFHLVGASHHSLLVDQGKTVVLVDAPNDAARARALLDWIDKNLPGGLAENAISHVIASHHHVDHSAGLRTIAALGATAVVAAPAVAMWEKIFAAPRTLDPDDLVGKPGKPAMVGVKLGEPFTLGNVTAHHITHGHSRDTLIVHVQPAGSAPAVFVADIYNPGAAILPKSNFVVWGQELDAALVALKLNQDGLLFLGGHGNADAMGNHLTVNYATFKLQLETAAKAI